MNSVKRYIDTTWDFRTSNTKEYTHCYHNYPAMMIPQVANKLISEYGKKSKILFDPYCGTGTSLVEANMSGIDAFGADLNPIARLIAKVKTTKIELQILDSHLKEFNDYLFALNFGIKKLDITEPNFKNVDFWFKRETKHKLANVKQFIDNIQNKKIQNFFLVAFSETVRESSLTRNGEFKLYRISQKHIKNFSPDVFKIISLKLVRNRNGLKDYIKKNKNQAKTNIYNFNSSENIKEITKNSIDIVVTSPPYGDSKTTVAYGQFSRLSNQWLNVKNASQIDNELMGGKTKSIEKTNISIIDKIIQKIYEKDCKRAKEVFSFYVDYSRSIANVANVIRPKGYACYVVGNRRVKNTILPTDEVTKYLFEKHGFKHKNTFIRNIPNKRMPSKNSPTNEIGKKATTMKNEYIVVMQKQ